MVFFRPFGTKHLVLSIFGASAVLWTRSKLDNGDNIQHEQNAISMATAKCMALKEKQGVPGLSVGVTVHGHLVWKTGFGLADIENMIPCTENTVMRIASISKCFTAIIAAKLVEDGKLKWDDDIRKYYSELSTFQFENKPVTVTFSQLLSHTSGIRHYTKKGEERPISEFDSKEYYLMTNYKNVDDALQIFIKDELLYEPGTTFEYTTHGYTLLSAVIEKIANKTYANIMKSLFEQLNLRSTYLDYPEEVIPNRSHYYYRRDRELKGVPYVDNSLKWAGGGLLSNVIDLLLFANTILQCLQSDRYLREKKLSIQSLPTHQQQKFLKSSSVNKLWTPVIRAETDETPELLRPRYYGFGWFISPEKHSSINELSMPYHIYHSGGAVGATSILLIAPCTNINCTDSKCGICVTILANLQSTSEMYNTALYIASCFASYSSCSSVAKKSN